MRSKDNRVEQVIVNIAASHTSMMVVNSDGLKASDLRPLVRFNIMVILKKERGGARNRGGGRIRLQRNTQ